MNKLSSDFLAFLLDKHNQTGKKDFMITDYMDFEGYQFAISELSELGVVYKTNDILGTIIVNIQND